MQNDLFGATLESARKETFEKARTTGGAICPCCDKFVKIYRRKFNSGMARALIMVYPFFKAHPQGWLDIHSYCIQRQFAPGDYGKLVWWGLMERKPCELNHSSLFRMTYKGFNFVERREFILSHAVEYMSRVETFDGENISIVDALGKHFDYKELMAETPRVTYAEV